MDKITYDVAMAQAHNHFTNRAEKLEAQELLFIAENEPNTPIVDALIRAKQIVRNQLQQELDSIKNNESNQIKIGQKVKHIDQDITGEVIGFDCGEKLVIKLDDEETTLVYHHRDLEVEND